MRDPVLHSQRSQLKGVQDWHHARIVLSELRAHTDGYNGHWEASGSYLG